MILYSTVKLKTITVNLIKRIPINICKYIFSNSLSPSVLVAGSQTPYRIESHCGRYSEWDRSHKVMPVKLAGLSNKEGQQNSKNYS